jgi:hypothetical protein
VDANVVERLEQQLALELDRALKEAAMVSEKTKASGGVGTASAVKSTTSESRGDLGAAAMPSSVLPPVGETEEEDARS